MIISFFVLLVRVLNSLIFIRSGVKSRFAGAGFEPAAYGFEDRSAEFPNLLKLLQSVEFV